MSTVRVYSAGAAESLVRRLEQQCAADGVAVAATFGAVGAMRERFLADPDCHLFITSARVLSEMTDGGQLTPQSVGDVGWVETALAVRTSDVVPDISTVGGLREALSSAPCLYGPDPVRSSAGIHFASVLQDLALGPQANVRSSPNGATAMRALAGSDDPPGALGCTQMTEILQTPGLTVAGPLPAPYALATLYQCALVRRAEPEDGADGLYDLLTGPSTAELRQELGFAVGNGA